MARTGEGLRDGRVRRETAIGTKRRSLLLVGFRNLKEWLLLLLYDYRQVGREGYCCADGGIDG